MIDCVSIYLFFIIQAEGISFVSLLETRKKNYIFSIDNTFFFFFKLSGEQAISLISVKRNNNLFTPYKFRVFS